jgi:hypothetical protein
MSVDVNWMVNETYRLIALLHERACETALIEITAMGGKYPMKRYLTSPVIAAQHAVEMNLQGMSAFVNVNPRSAFSGFERDVPYVSALFLDLQPEKTSIEEVAKRLTIGNIPPTVTGVSGHGVHMYLLLSQPADPSKAKIIWERLCKYTGSDPVFSINRIARLPGCVNWKVPPAWGYITEFQPERRYTIEQIDFALDRLGAGPARTPKEGIAVPVNPTQSWIEIRTQLSEGVRDIIDTGEKNAFSAQQITRSEADWVVVCALVRAGATDDTIIWVYETQPVGILKYREAGPHYLRKTIEAARRANVEAVEPTGRGRVYDAPRRHNGSSGDNYRRRLRW